MKKQYEPENDSKQLPTENIEAGEVSEPAIEYGSVTEMKFSPPLTEEELKDSMTTEEFKEYWFRCIDEIYKK